MAANGALSDGSVTKKDDSYPGHSTNRTRHIRGVHTELDSDL